MDQNTRRHFLINSLLHENSEYADVKVPDDEQGQKQLLRALFNVRLPAPIGADFLEVQDEYLKEENRLKGITSLADLTPVQDGLYIWQGDITTLKCDAIVNAASVENAFHSGNYNLAREKSEKANKWCNITLIVGIIFWVLYIIYIIVCVALGVGIGLLEEW